MSTFDLHVNRRSDVQHPYILFGNPRDSVRQIAEHLVTRGTGNPHDYAENHKAGAKYTFASGAHGAGCRIDLTTAEYPAFLDILRRYMHYLDAEGNPRELVVRYGQGNNDELTCTDITTYMEGHYRHDREERTVTFYPKDGNDVIYVMGLVSQYQHMMSLVRKEVVVHKAETEMHAATGIFATISHFTGVPHIRDRNHGGIRFLCMNEDQYRNVSDELMAYKVAYVMDEWK